MLIHILAIRESALEIEANRFCSPKARGRVDNDCVEELVMAADHVSMGSFEVIMDRREVLEHRYIEVMLVDARICRQEPVVDRIWMERVARGRTAGLELLPFFNKNISSKRDLLAPMPSILVFAFKWGHEIFGSNQTSRQISGFLDRKKVDVLFIGRMKTGNASNFLIEVVVPDLSRASLVNRRQLD